MGLVAGSKVQAKDEGRRERGSPVDGQLECRKGERKTNSGGCTKESGVKRM